MKANLQELKGKASEHFEEMKGKATEQFEERKDEMLHVLCPPVLSLLVSALFRWPCSISIHLSSR